MIRQAVNIDWTDWGLGIPAPDHYFHAAVALDCERHWRFRVSHLHSPGAGLQRRALADVPGLRGVRNLLVWASLTAGPTKSNSPIASSLRGVEEWQNVPVSE